MWVTKRIFDLIMFLIMLMILIYYLSQPIELVKEGDLYKVKNDNRVPIAVTTIAATFFLISPDYIGLISESKFEGYQFENLIPENFLPPVPPKKVLDELLPPKYNPPSNISIDNNNPGDKKTLDDLIKLENQLADLIGKYEDGKITDNEINSKLAAAIGGSISSAIVGGGTLLYLYKNKISDAISNVLNGAEEFNGEIAERFLSGEQSPEVEDYVSNMETEFTPDSSIDRQLDSILERLKNEDEIEPTDETETSFIDENEIENGESELNTIEAESEGFEAESETIELSPLWDEIANYGQTLDTVVLGNSSPMGYTENVFYPTTEPLEQESGNFFQRFLRKFKRSNEEDTFDGEFSEIDPETSVNFDQEFESDQFINPEEENVELDTIDFADDFFHGVEPETEETTFDFELEENYGLEKANELDSEFESESESESEFVEPLTQESENIFQRFMRMFKNNTTEEEFNGDFPEYEMNDFFHDIDQGEDFTLDTGTEVETESYFTSESAPEPSLQNLMSTNEQIEAEEIPIDTFQNLMSTNEQIGVEEIPMDTFTTTEVPVETVADTTTLAIEPAITFPTVEPAITGTTSSEVLPEASVPEEVTQLTSSLSDNISTESVEGLSTTVEEALPELETIGAEAENIATLGIETAGIEATEAAEAAEAAIMTTGEVGEVIAESLLPLLAV